MREDPVQKAIPSADDPLSAIRLGITWVIEIYGRSRSYALAMRSVTLSGNQGGRERLR